MHRWLLLSALFSIAALPTEGAHAFHCAPDARVMAAQTELSVALAFRARSQGDLGAACRHRAQALRHGRALYAYVSQPKCGHPENFNRAWRLEELAARIEWLEALRQQDCARTARS